MLFYRRSLHSFIRLYNWFCFFYAPVEKVLGPELELIIRDKIVPIPNIEQKTALEYACGTGLLTYKIAPYFKFVHARDLSSGMLRKGRQRNEKATNNIVFSEGNILQIDEAEKTYDWVFVSCALHLFSPEEEIRILKQLCLVAREGVVIIDHSKKWNFIAAFVEWLEGSYYDKFVCINFSEVARKVGAKEFNELNYKKCSVMIFSHFD